MPRISFPAALNSPERGGQVVPHLHGEDLPGGHVVAVAEAAGDAEDLEVGQQGRLLQHAVDVQRLRLGAGQLEGPGGLLVAIGARGAEDQDVGRHERLI